MCAKMSQVDFSSQDPEHPQAKQGDEIIVDNPNLPHQRCDNSQADLLQQANVAFSKNMGFFFWLVLTGFL